MRNRFNKLDKSQQLDIYKHYIDITENISKESQYANTFFIAINTAIIGSSAFGTLHGRGVAIILLSIFGIITNIAWCFWIESAQKLNGAKYKIIYTMEAEILGIQDTKPFTEKCKLLSSRGRIPFSDIMKWLPFILSIVYALLLIYTLRFRVMQLFLWLCKS